MIALAEAVTSFAVTRRVSRPGLPRDAFERWQHRRLAHWLAHDLPRAPFYGTAPQSLTDLPIVDKALVMAQFERFNIHGITADEAWAAIKANKPVGRLTVGASTGTSGNRGLFVISDAERFRWLGTILAKTVSDLLWQCQRIAIILPQNTGLYDSARRTGRIDLRFFDLTLGPDAWRADIEAFRPTVLVAPPKILRHLATEGFKLAPTRVFSAAETLDPVDRPVIEDYFKLPLDQIYMATEGLFALTCRHGGLHLAEDSVHFEWEPAGDGLVMPLVTQFRRQTQIMARYRMNDLMRLASEPCRCGSPLKTVAEIVGRADDIFRLPSSRGTQLFTPDILRNAVLDADRRIDDFRLVQTGPQAVTLSLKPDLAEDAVTAAATALEALFARRGAAAKLTVLREPMPLDTGRKLRRVECRSAVSS